MTTANLAGGTASWSEKERAAWEPQPAVSVAQWARENIRLTKKMGASIPGAYDPDITPWVHVIFDAFCDRRVEGIVFVKPAQIGGSLTVQILISYVIDCEPANVIYFLDTDTNAKWASVHRVQPMIDSQPSLRQKVAVPHKRGKLELPFDGGVAVFAGANSVSQLGNKSAPIVIRDETGKWREKLGAEAGALENAGERVEGQYYYKLIDLSTPVQEGDPILKQWALSDQTRIYLPCPLCGHYQELVWEQVKWPKDSETGLSVSPAEARKDTWYECMNCGGRIEEKEKHWMLKHWRPVKKGQQIVRLEKETAGGVEDWTVTWPNGEVCRYQLLGEIEFNPVVGLHISRLYSAWRSWGQLAARWLKIGDDLSARQAFYNSVLALPWKQRTLKPDEDKIQGHIWPTARPLCVPEGFEYITAGADVQLRNVYYGVWAWRADGASHLIEYGEMGGIEQLEAVAAGLYAKNDDSKSGVGAFFVDSRYQTGEVEDFCRRYANAFACKGSVVAAVPRTGPVSLAYVKTDSKGRKLPPSNWRAYVSVHTGSFKEELHMALEIEWDFKGIDPPPRYVSFHADTEMDFIRPLTAEERVEKQDIRGRVTHEWVQKSKDNHYLDTTVYARAAWRYFQNEWIRQKQKKKKKRRVGMMDRYS